MVSVSEGLDEAPLRFGYKDTKKSVSHAKRFAGKVVENARAAILYVRRIIALNRRNIFCKGLAVKEIIRTFAPD